MKPDSIFSTAIVVFVILALFFLFARAVRAHDWYPKDCCHDQECRHAAPGEITATEKGFFIRRGIKNPKGETLQKDVLIEYGSGLIKPFPPEAFAPEYRDQPAGPHLCIFPGGIRCLFMDPRI